MYHRRSRSFFLLLALSFARYDRVGRMLRPTRSIWSGLPTRFNFGSGAGRWWSAPALFNAYHGIIWWITDMVEHPGELALRGGIRYHRKDTCTATSAHAE
eukprot:9468449-Pyramimonas_sp.AAC.1